MKGQTNLQILRQRLQRGADLRAAGFRVLRFWDNEVLRDVEVVRNSIWKALHNPPPSQPSP